MIQWNSFGTGQIRIKAVASEFDDWNFMDYLPILQIWLYSAKNKDPKMKLVSKSTHMWMLTECDTRWCYRHSVIRAYKDCYRYIVHARNLCRILLRTRYLNNFWKTKARNYYCCNDEFHSGKLQLYATWRNMWMKICTLFWNNLHKYFLLIWKKFKTIAVLDWWS